MPWLLVPAQHPEHGPEQQQSLWVPKGFPAPGLEQEADPKPLHSLDFAWSDPGDGLGEEQVLVPAQGKVVEVGN